MVVANTFTVATWNYLIPIKLFICIDIIVHPTAKCIYRLIRIRHLKVVTIMLLYVHPTAKLFICLIVYVNVLQFPLTYHINRNLACLSIKIQIAS